MFASAWFLEGLGAIAALSVKAKVSNKMKFMQMLDSQTYRVLQKEAKIRGASIQELLRTVIIPDWLSEHRRKERS